MWKGRMWRMLLATPLLGAAFLTACLFPPSEQSPPPDEYTPGSYEVVVQPGQSIQAAIDSAPAGAVISLGEGKWEENLVITKDLTLKGLGPGTTVIENPGCQDPALLVRNEDNGHHVEVSIENLMISGTAVHCDVNTAEQDQGRPSPRIPIPFPSPPAGIEVDWGADVKLWNLLVFGNPGVGIRGGFGSVLDIEDSWIAENGADGIETWGATVIKNSLILDNAGNGVLTYSELYMEGCTVRGNYLIGHWCGDTAHATLELVRNTISANNRNGFKVYIYTYTEPPPAPSAISSDTSPSVILDIHMTLECNSIVGNKEHGVDCEEMFREGFVFTGVIKGADNEISGNGGIDVEPEALGFLTTSEGGCYGPGYGQEGDPL